MTSSWTRALKVADEQSSTQSALETVDDPIKGCESKTKTKIDVQVVGEDDVGLANVALVLSRGDGQQLGGKTNSSGSFSFVRLDPGSFKLDLPELDKEAWELIETIALADDKCSGEAAWQAEKPFPVQPGFVHIVEQGDCTASLGDRFGFFPETIWDHAKNDDLRAKRDNMYILAPGDELFIPELQSEPLSVQTANQYRIRRRGVPELLQIRFLDSNEKPRSAIPYLLDLAAEDGRPIAAITAETDADGFVIQPIPPDASKAIVTLGHGKDQEIHEFDVGHVDPIDTVAGAQARLKNLGYECGDTDGVLGDRTRAAIEEFQDAVEVPVTGEYDDATLEALKNAFLS